MDFLLECIGFPPEYDHDGLPDLVRQLGEATPWRDPDGADRRLALGGGLELRLDEGDQLAGPDVWPFYASPGRLRLAVDSVDLIPDAPFDGLLRGLANPPRPGFANSETSFRFTTWVGDRRRLPRPLESGHVLAVSTAGFALDIAQVGGRPRGLRPEGRISPLGGDEDPGGCVELHLPILAAEELENPITGLAVQRLEVHAPGTPLSVFVSRWQLEADGLRTPAVGDWLRGTFLFSGRISGGLPSPTRRLGRAFG
ncbi:hypothetical protein [Engelhardtia mirabilis]|uniref:Uncharacterized protein n=1 Tax=Engelhardtia mirabilis TaxID=2528011 RepID=A0A518BIZ9_9BACT|nr:hypothetical protein Pla133_20360 [Planctomycetes bacterium Pla133]QDV01288.1 hypothetical protein Pla86_20370 [Planctomycetes bacterium Pla86]